MKIVNKHELATYPAGTPFYNLKENEVKQLINGKWVPVKGEYDIVSGIKFLLNPRLDYDDGVAHFNGVLELVPDYSYVDNIPETYFMVDNLPEFELSSWDDADADYSDEDKFLVLDKKEFKYLLDELIKLYNIMEE